MRHIFANTVGRICKLNLTLRHIHIFIGSKSNHGNRLPCLEWSVSLVFKHQNTDLLQVYLLQKEASKYFLKFIRVYFRHQGRIKHSKMSRFILPLTVYLIFDAQ